VLSQGTFGHAGQSGTITIKDAKDHITHKTTGNKIKDPSSWSHRVNKGE